MQLTDWQDVLLRTRDLTTASNLDQRPRYIFLLQLGILIIRCPFHPEDSWPVLRFVNWTKKVWWKWKHAFEGWKLVIWKHSSIIIFTFRCLKYPEVVIMDIESEEGIRSVVLRRSESSGMGLGLGFSIMGGAGYEFPPVIYGIERDSPAARCGMVSRGVL